MLKKGETMTDVRQYIPPCARANYKPFHRWMQLSFMMKKKNNPQTLSKGKDLCYRMDQIRKEVDSMQSSEENFLLSDTSEHLFTGILNLADFCCGDVEWADIKQFLKEAGIKVPDKFDRQMAEMDR